MNSTDFSQILGGEYGEELSGEPEESARMYGKVVFNFDNTDHCYSHHVQSASKYVFSKLGEREQARWADRVTREDIWKYMILLDERGQQKPVIERIRLIIGSIPTDKAHLVPATRMAEWNGSEDKHLRQAGMELAALVAQERNTIAKTWKETAKPAGRKL